MLCSVASPASRLLVFPLTVADIVTFSFSQASSVVIYVSIELLFTHVIDKVNDMGYWQPPSISRWTIF